MNEGESSSSEKKTLLNSLEKLSNNAQELERITMMSGRLVDKFDRADDRPKEVVNKEEITVRAKEPDLIDMFNIVSNRLADSIRNIEKNLDDVMQRID